MLTILKYVKGSLERADADNISRDRIWTSRTNDRLSRHRYAWALTNHLAAKSRVDGRLS